MAFFNLYHKYVGVGLFKDSFFFINLFAALVGFDPDPFADVQVEFFFNLIEDTLGCHQITSFLTDEGHALNFNIVCDRCQMGRLFYQETNPRSIA